MPGVKWTADHAEPGAHNFVLGITDPELIETLYIVASGTVLDKTRKQFLYCWVDGIQVSVRVRVFSIMSTDILSIHLCALQVALG
jgi:hypothetical protein